MLAKVINFLKTYSKKYRAPLIVILVMLIAAITTQLISRQRQFIANRDSDISTAMTNFDNGGHQSAIKELENRYSADKNDKKVAEALATFYFRDKDYQKFEQFATKNKLESTQFQTMLAFVARVNGQQDKAIGYYQKAIELSPRNPIVYLDLSNYYQVLGKNQQALDVIKTGLSFAPNSSQLNLFAANLSLVLGDKAAAKNYANNVLKYDNNNQRAREILSKK